jgi:branched-chain amino acid transport system permease protein
MEFLIQQILAGLAAGGIYASLGLALVMIYRATHLINFAQGEMATFSTYIALKLIRAGLPYSAAFVVTVIVSFALGVTIERVIVRPVERAPHLTVVIVLVGLMIVFNSMSGWLFGTTLEMFPSPFASSALFENRLISPHAAGSIIVVFAVLGVVHAFFRYTPIGLAMRAAAQNETSSRLAGIRVGWMLALGWGLAAAIGSVAGMMVAPTVYLDPNMMAGILLYAFAGALLGGIESPMGAVLGGFIVGVAENLIGTYVIGPELKLSAALILIIGILIVRPAGLFGVTYAVKV